MRKGNWNFEIEVGFMGYNRHKYRGAFPDRVEKVIKSLVKSPCLHLFSGVSKIGDVKIDLIRPEATHNQDVFEFIKSDEAKRQWEWCILDPPYNIKNREVELKDYADKTPISASVPKRRALAEFFRKYCKNVLWLDQCAPLPKGFIRKKVWFFFPGGYRTIRVLSWLQNIELK
jgi:hypothetical protein